MNLRMELLADACILTITAPDGELLRVPLDQLDDHARLSENVITAVYVGERTDPETGEVRPPRRYAIMIKELGPAPEGPWSIGRAT